MGTPKTRYGCNPTLKPEGGGQGQNRPKLEPQRVFRIGHVSQTSSTQDDIATHQYFMLIYPSKQTKASKTRTLRQKVGQKHVPLGRKSASRRQKHVHLGKK